LKQAQESDERRRKKETLGALGFKFFFIERLDGIPISLKDAYCVKGVKTTMASKMLENFTSPYNSFVYEKLFMNSGAVLIGKTNLVRIHKS
jgi:aspartyl-tRNA(Asn)/glutamyl-tRNA(Gln) amidotransferase subunit A